jgi:hypothetical protein
MVLRIREKYSARLELGGVRTAALFDWNFLLLMQ